MSPAERHHKPVRVSSRFFEQRQGGADPETISQAAHSSAHALLSRGRATTDPQVTARLVEFTDHFGIEALAQMWAEAPGVSLPGALWRIYALRDSVRSSPQAVGHYYELGQQDAQVSRVVAGVADPPGAEEVMRTVDEILTGAYTGDFDLALQRFAAFCRVLALGQAMAADEADVVKYFAEAGSGARASEFFQETGESRHGIRLTASSRRLVTTAEELDAAAASWRAGHLD